MKMKLSLARVCLLSFGVLFASPGLAQLAAPSPSLPSESDPAALLSENLKALARDPYNVDALVQAGHGALAIGDANAAFGFFARAEELSPQNWRAKAGLGSSLTMLEKSREALRVFEEAIALGAPEQDLLADRGLAHDLEGDGKKAQRDYLAALRLRPSDDVTRRLALSLGISGEKDAALARLDPLVRTNDQGAWRARAFILAMNGDAAGAERIVRVVASPETASSMLGFMQRLAGLSASAKAHAVHFGTLPANGSNSPTLLAEDGFRPLDAGTAMKLAVTEPARRTPNMPSDATAGEARRTVHSARDPQLAVLAARGRAAANMAASGMAAVLPPAEAPKGGIATLAEAPSVPPSASMGTTAPPAARFEVPPAPARATASVQLPSRSLAAAAGAPSPASISTAPAPVAPPPMVVAEKPSVPAVQTASVPASTATAMPLPELGTGPAYASTTDRPTEPSAAPVAGPSAEPQVAVVDSRTIPDAASPTLAEVPASAPAASPPVMAQPPVSAPAAQRPSLGQIVNTLQLEAESAPVALPDAAKLKALRLAAQKKAAAEEKARAEKAEQERKAAEEAAKARRNPARLWVQIATGRNTAGLPGTWRSLKSKAPKALGDQKPWSVGYLQTNRLVVGPVKSSKAARALVQDLAKEGIKAMVFNSEAGQEVERVDN